ncbi:Cell fate regulator YaaT, PSP1 superfamily (controls sporulation, competence, biofilm development) [Dyadobacter soli]|uniref:Cell fate regulator YaaT, PSP1 superfamily (Controls sporulation, competence, biofilm development) n=1 Tax=Dyadobacter soli TaxID=659014 RepID=A0A1G7EXW0_9BACT|nr:regulatory iron-sulfur-containing complex subunit RicT [Dyadobacter soli]SDE68205.1 Cell fate regulator YaaT, PSP1 superfamily (controls sporulation, competence, biofilm development) [Dyadobacter soli]
MNVFDWLSHMDVPSGQRFDVIEVKFKGGRKEYFRNINQLEFVTGDYVVCEMASGQHIGTVSLQGELVRLQMKRKSVQMNDDLHVIYRIATEKDLDKFTQAMAREMPTLYRTREIIRDMKLNMKLSDVEYQSDNTKTTFYYSSEERVDFRELIKSLASEFKVRIEMRQISLRQEASRLGGLGSCGRELCCSTWLTDFKNISTAAARYQNLSLNPAKLSGQCGRLKCCLNYELETYIDALRDIPTVDAPLKTKKGVATLQKTDIFKKIMWFGFDKDTNWYPVPIDKVLEIIDLNKKDIIPESLEILTPEPERGADKVPGKLNSDLENLDKKYSDEQKKKKKKKSRSGKNRGNGGPENSAGESAGSDAVSSPPAENTGSAPQNKGNNQGQRNRGNNQGGEGRNRGNNQGEGPRNRGNNQGDESGNRGNNQGEERQNKGNQGEEPRNKGNNPNEGQRNRGNNQGGEPKNKGNNNNPGGEPRNKGNNPEGNRNSNEGNRNNRNRNRGPKPAGGPSGGGPSGGGPSGSAPTGAGPKPEGESNG